jgi:hypothetical protein
MPRPWARRAVGQASGARLRVNEQRERARARAAWEREKGLGELEQASRGGVALGSSEQGGASAMDGTEQEQGEGGAMAGREHEQGEDEQREMSVVHWIGGREEAGAVARRSRARRAEGAAREQKWRGRREGIELAEKKARRKNLGRGEDRLGACR